MSIIEREIEKRETLIAEYLEKKEEAKTLRERAEKLESEAAEIDVETLQAEANELKEYLPKQVEQFEVLGVDEAKEQAETNEPELEEV